MKGKLFSPKTNMVYQNRNGITYRCVEASSERSVFVSIPGGWMLNAHGVRMYASGKIDWDYSEGGHFVRV